jgi:hypothetical protein
MCGDQMSDFDKFGMSRGLADLINFANFGVGQWIRFGFFKGCKWTLSLSVLDPSTALRQHT